MVDTRFRTEVITGSVEWTVPEYTGNSITVRIFGGGGGGFWSGCDGGGWMNNGEFKLTPNEKINIVIGKGGRKENTGGTTMFGTYLSANGGRGGSGGGDGGSGGNYSGGGGGYDKGADGGEFCGGGGGYFSKGGDGRKYYFRGCGGGGGYGDGGDSYNSAGLGAGGGYDEDGGSGVCIIQYYT